MNKVNLNVDYEIYEKINKTECIYPKNKTICNLFEEQVASNPNKRAIIMGKESLSYGELNKKAEQVASLLQKQGVVRNSIVGIMVERSFEMMIGIFAILKAGAAYLPISTEYPYRRISYIIKDSNVNILLTQKKFIENIDHLNIKIIDLENINNYCVDLDRERVDTQPEDLMYVIYTSGSTGKPKGVLVNNYSVVNRLNWMQKVYPITSNDTLLQKTPFAFDVSVWELFWWAITGSKLSILKPGYEKFPPAIIESIFNDKVTVIHFVPSMFNSFLNYAFNDADMERISSIKKIFCSGEALLSAYVNKFNESLGKVNGTELINLYGPTETTVDVTYYNCPKNNVDVVPIGYPIDNTRVYIISEGKLQPAGFKGELCIAGEGLARGYINKPNLTRKFFIENPIVPGERIYRTGDYASLMHNGAILYHGRIDNQVKIRGVRIELGEIESKVCEVQGVEQCVTVIKNPEKVNAAIIAYIVLKSNYKEVGTSNVKKYLEKNLPKYMIPSQFIIIDNLPITLNGKIDRNGLLELAYK